MPKNKKQLENEIKALREGAEVRHKKLRNQLKNYCSQSFNNLGIVNDQKSFEKVERLLKSLFTYDKIGTFSQKMIEWFIKNHINDFDLQIEQTDLWKTLNGK